ncbi:vWA domain-containing protein [Baaleninema simplex]|uniref:vWA domain-containing protein n=1 Tax=Baaleninema simplex TaxID=2862350 RepID=UPI000349F427|nr:VWA domain-containing protein [Baaleninema simplex]
MNVRLETALSDPNLDATRSIHQRQLAVSVAAVADSTARPIPLNLCSIVDRSGSMAGYPLATVKQATQRLVDRLSLLDHLSVVAFDRQATVLVNNQPLLYPAWVKGSIGKIQARGGTALDEGLKRGIHELFKGRQHRVSQAFVLTDGDNEHGSDDRCLKLAQLAAQNNLTLNVLGFGDRWNTDILERIADASGGSLVYVETPNDAIAALGRLFDRARSVALTNAYLEFRLSPGVRLAQFKPLAQVEPETKELSPVSADELPPEISKEGWVSVRLGDVMTNAARVAIANLYLEGLPEGQHPVAEVRVRYTNPVSTENPFVSQVSSVEANVTYPYIPSEAPHVTRWVLALAKYRQIQIAEAKLRQGDRSDAVTMLQAAIKTALQLKDTRAAEVLKTTVSHLKMGKQLSDRDCKQTRIVSKSVFVN